MIYEHRAGKLEDKATQKQKNAGMCLNFKLMFPKDPPFIYLIHIYTSLGSDNLEQSDEEENYRILLLEGEEVSENDEKFSV